LKLWISYVNTKAKYISFVARVEHGLTTFKDRKLRRIFGIKGEKIKIKAEI
jgi:hypothetical protein